jgi:arabinose-5-phosphate isomerase
LEHFEKTLQILKEAISSIEENEFNTLKEDCIGTLNAGGKIVASGLGKNVPICEKFVGSLNSVGVPAAFMHTNSATHGDLGIVRDGDLVITLTKSGETAESIYLVQELKKRDCKIWLLSFSRDSSLYRELPKRLIMRLVHEGDEWDILPNNSTLLNLIVLQELAMQIIKEQGITLDALRKNHPGGAIGVQLK